MLREGRQSRNKHLIITDHTFMHQSWLFIATSDGVFMFLPKHIWGNWGSSHQLLLHHPTGQRPQRCVATIMAIMALYVQSELPTRTAFALSGAFCTKMQKVCATEGPHPLLNHQSSWVELLHCEGVKHGADLHCSSIRKQTYLCQYGSNI